MPDFAPRWMDRPPDQPRRPEEDQPELQPDKPFTRPDRQGTDTRGRDRRYDVPVTAQFPRTRSPEEVANDVIPGTHADTSDTAAPNGDRPNGEVKPDSANNKANDATESADDARKRQQAETGSATAQTGAIPTAEVPDDVVPEAVPDGGSDTEATPRKIEHGPAKVVTFVDMNDLARKLSRLVSTGIDPFEGDEEARAAVAANSSDLADRPKSAAEQTESQQPPEPPKEEPAPAEVPPPAEPEPEPTPQPEEPPQAPELPPPPPEPEPEPEEPAPQPEPPVEAPAPPPAVEEPQPQQPLGSAPREASTPPPAPVQAGDTSGRPDEAPQRDIVTDAAVEGDRVDDTWYDLREAEPAEPVAMAPANQPPASGPVDAVIVGEPGGGVPAPPASESDIPAGPLEGGIPAAPDGGAVSTGETSPGNAYAAPAAPVGAPGQTTVEVGSDGVAGEQTAPSYEGSAGSEGGAAPGEGEVGEDAGDDEEPLQYSPTGGGTSVVGMSSQPAVPAHRPGEQYAAPPVAPVPRETAPGDDSDDTTGQSPSSGGDSSPESRADSSADRSDGQATQDPATRPRATRRPKPEPLRHPSANVSRARDVIGGIAGFGAGIVHSPKTVVDTKVGKVSRGKGILGAFKYSAEVTRPDGSKEVVTIKATDPVTARLRLKLRPLRKELFS